jgi:alcohol dehydrogenase class IV
LCNLPKRRPSCQKISHAISIAAKIMSPMSAPIATFSFPTPTLYGPGTLAEIPLRLPGLGIRKPLVVTDPGLLPTESFNLLDKALAPLGPKGQGWALFSEVHPNPIESDVVNGARAYRENNCDGVIAFGGGSALDVGKAIRLLIKRPDLQLEDFKYMDDWRGLAPCVCIPTTAGTGSEVGRSSVLTIERTGRKAVFFQPALLASLVILDAEVTVSLPPKLTAATGADALTHCIESYTCPVFHPLCDGIALEGIHLIIEALPRAVKVGADLDARGRMLVAAAMGAIAFQKDLGATHSLAHPLSTICKLHHGLANALCLPHVMRFNSERMPGLYRRVGNACGLEVLRATDKEADVATIMFITKFIEDTGLRLGLRAHGVNESHIPALAEQAFDDPCHKTNPVPCTKEDLTKLYYAAL